MKRLVIFFALSAALLAAVAAAPLTASWVDGRVQRKIGSGWVDVNMGDQLDSAATVRLGPGATAEFDSGGRRVSLTAPGVYVLDSLFHGGSEITKQRSNLLDKLAALVDPSSHTSDTTVAGIRGDLIGDQASGGMTWESDSSDADSLMSAARQLAREKKYAEAAAKFGEAAGAADGDTRDNATYSQAWALAANGQTAESVKILREMLSAGVWAGPRALLLGRLDIDSGAKDEARTLLQTALDNGSLAGNDIQVAKDMITETSK